MRTKKRTNRGKKKETSAKEETSVKKEMEQGKRKQEEVVFDSFKRSKKVVGLLDEVKKSREPYFLKGEELQAYRGVPVPEPVLEAIRERKRKGKGIGQDKGIGKNTNNDSEFAYYKISLFVTRSGRTEAVLHGNPEEDIAKVYRALMDDPSVVHTATTSFAHVLKNVPISETFARNFDRYCEAPIYHCIEGRRFLLKYLRETAGYYTNVDEKDLEEKKKDKNLIFYDFGCDADLLYSDIVKHMLQVLVL